MGNLTKDMKKKPIILEKPSGTIAIADPMTALQRKFYDAFLYIAKETLKKNPSKTDFEVPLKELKEFFGIEDKKNTYIKGVIKDLMKLIAEYDILDKTQERWGAFSILPFVDISIDLETKVGIVKFEIPTLVRKAMLNNQGIFGKIDLVVIRGLNSKYAIILYELLKDYENVEIPEMDIKTFRKIFGIVDKYKLFQDLKKRVLKPAIKEINENPHIEWKVDYKLIKTGSKYTHIKFIKKKKPVLNRLEQSKEYKSLESKINVLLGLLKAEYRENKSIKKYFINALQEHPIDYIEAQIKLVNERNNVNDYIAYLKKAIEEDYAGFNEAKEKEKELREEMSVLINQYFKRATAIYNNLSDRDKQAYSSEIEGICDIARGLIKRDESSGIVKNEIAEKLKEYFLRYKK